jgi:lipoprotein-anchoring transpeptidase ErfK/SrfK
MTRREAAAMAACGFGSVVLATPGLAKQARRKAAPALDPASINNPSLQHVITGEMSGPAVLRAQILLDRANFSPGEIDGTTGDNFYRAVAGFRASRNMPGAAAVDHGAWTALNADSAPALVEHTITAEDVKGPFLKVPADMMQQSKLEQLGYESPAEALGEMFHISPKALAALNPNAKFAAGDKILVPNVLTPPPGKAASVKVSKAGLIVSAMDQGGRVLAQYPATIGSDHDPLPVGSWKIKGVAKYPPFHYNPKLFWDADPSHSKAKIAPGPNNPVGAVWIDLTKEHYGIHGTPDPAKVGHSQSHGCIRLTNWDALELAELVSPGTPAELVEA